MQKKKLWIGGGVVTALLATALSIEPIMRATFPLKEGEKVTAPVPEEARKSDSITKEQFLNEVNEAMVMVGENIASRTEELKPIILHCGTVQMEVGGEGPKFVGIKKDNPKESVVILDLKPQQEHLRALWDRLPPEQRPTRDEVNEVATTAGRREAAAIYEKIDAEVKDSTLGFIIKPLMPGKEVVVDYAEHLVKSSVEEMLASRFLVHEEFLKDQRRQELQKKLIATNEERPKDTVEKKAKGGLGGSSHER